jgi:hydroxymethylglutaryl-CoA lyase
MANRIPVNSLRHQTTRSLELSTAYMSSQEKIPVSVELCEVGPRDGFQFESLPIPTELKIEVIRGLVEAGLGTIQLTSFVHPVKVPQMADAEQVVAAFSSDKRTRFTGLCLNMRGIERASASGLKYVDISIATNEQHGTDNAGMSVRDGVAHAVDMITAATSAGMEVQLGLQTVFGYKQPGDTPLDQILEFCRLFAELGLESLSIADSTGMANRDSIRERVTAVQSVIGPTPLVLHLHDTRGLGLLNMYTAMQLGVRRFDTSLGGLGGCPFIPGASGNIATEDAAYLCESLGIETGISIPGVALQSRRIADHLGRRLAGKLYAL